MKCNSRLGSGPQCVATSFCPKLDKLPWKFKLHAWQDANMVLGNGASMFSPTSSQLMAAVCWWLMNASYSLVQHKICYLLMLCHILHCASYMLRKSTILVGPRHFVARGEINGTCFLANVERLELHITSHALLKHHLKPQENLEGRKQHEEKSKILQSSYWQTAQSILNCEKAK